MKGRQKGEASESSSETSIKDAIQKDVEKPFLVIGKDIPLKLIDGEFCRVVTILPFAHIDEKGAVRSTSPTMPYAFLHIESPRLPKDTVCHYQVVHKEDFRHICEAINERDSSTQELLIVYEDNPYEYQRSKWSKLWFKSTKGILPRLHVFISKKGGLEKIYDSSLQGEQGAHEKTNMLIKEWKPIEGYSD